MISAENIYVNFGGFELFKGVTFLVNPKDRIGLVGKNGAGKSTLLKMLSGSEQPSAGKITIPKSVTIGYLPQQMQVADRTFHAVAANVGNPHCVILLDE
ncbi:Diaminopimelate epimerase, partial [hydrothermal vent metagenome]